MSEDKLAKVKVNKPAELRYPAQEYVFFCEGSDEENLVKEIKLSNATIKATTVPKPGDNNSYFFTPQTVLDYYLIMAGAKEKVDLQKYPIDWLWQIIEPQNNKNKGLCVDDVRNNNAKIRLLVDTDVFFKRVNFDYNNLNEDDRQTLNNNCLHSQSRIDLLNRFSTPPIENQEYEFLEQELTFEDFVVLFFVGKDEDEEYDPYYLQWFTNRFGINRETNSERRIYREGHHGDLINQNTNGIKLKEELIVKLTQYDEEFRNKMRSRMADFWENNLTRQTLDHWLDEVTHHNNQEKKNKLATFIADWVGSQPKIIKDRITTANRRMLNHPNWPQNFGLIDFLREHLNIKETNNER